MAQISQLYNKDNQKVYPVTLSTAVVNPNNGKAISDQINNLKLNNTQYGQIILSPGKWDAEAKIISAPINNVFGNTFNYNPETSIVYIYPSDDCIKQYKNSGIECANITENVFSFTAKVIPVTDINIDIFIINREQNT